ncbi:hypothetical protein Syun_014028 [Stephania yunnanensis]|uniref:Uncharacterized protein n=1 Tax=Stephania yunnanensis TaxID=152371 RepID=A0AAP0JII0_9MAGN
MRMDDAAKPNFLVVICRASSSDLTSQVRISSWRVDQSPHNLYLKSIKCFVESALHYSKDISIGSGAQPSFKFECDGHHKSVN